MKSLKDKIAEIVLNDFIVNNEKIAAIAALIEAEKEAAYDEGREDGYDVGCIESSLFYGDE